MRRSMLLPVVLLTFLAAPAAAQIQYFGYHESGRDDLGLNLTKGYTNFSYLSTSDDLYDTVVPSRVNAMAQQGMKAVIELGKVLWCDPYLDGTYPIICQDWQQRWNAWRSYNAGILTPDKLLAVVVRDEPFNWNVDMAVYDTVAATVKADLAAAHPNVKVMLLEADCVVTGGCGRSPGAFDRYTGMLPSVDWIGLNTYGIHPETNPTYQNALSKIKARFPGKKRIYNMDAWFSPTYHAGLGSINAMGPLAQEYYRLAQTDPDAVALGITSWVNIEDGIGTKYFPCSVVAEHVRIGREITGRPRAQTGQAFGVLENVAHGTGVATGWACDPDGTVCEYPQVDFYLEGSYLTTATYPSTPALTNYVVNPQCGTGIGTRFQQWMSIGTRGRAITAQVRDLDAGSAQLPSNCPDNPACVWFTQTSEPKGYMEAISPTGVVSGWACDPDGPTASNKVRLVLGNGTPIGTFTTNLASEQAVADECGGGYLHRFSVQLPAWARYQPVYAYSRDLVQSWWEIQIPWLCEPGSYCTWW